MSVQSRYRYSGVKWTWYRLGLVAEPRAAPLSAPSEWSHVTVLQLTNISLEDAGTYVCTAVLISDGKEGESLALLQILTFLLQIRIQHL